MGVNRTGVIREVKAGAKTDSRNEVLVVVLLDLHAVRCRSVVTLGKAVGQLNLRLDVGALHKLEGVPTFQAQAEGVRVEVDGHVADLDVILEVAVAGYEVDVGSLFERSRTVYRKAVEISAGVSGVVRAVTFTAVIAATIRAR